MALNVMRFLPEPAATQLNRLRLSQPGRGVITGGAQSAEHGAGNARPTSSLPSWPAHSLAHYRVGHQVERVAQMTGEYVDDYGS
jgi:hypothetical protein